MVVDFEVPTQKKI